MELSIKFECPQCRQAHLQRLLDLTPGQARTCPHCGTPVGLTVQGLDHLRQDLIQFVGR